MNTMKKNAVLYTLAKLLTKNIQTILEVNQKDIDTCRNIDESMLDRLKINENKIIGMIASVNKTIELEDPEGKILYEYQHNNGMKIENKSVPFGKILIIYESRPDVTIEASVLAFKAGNKVLLKGGKEAKETNKILVDLWQQALSENGENKDRIIYLDGDREQIKEIIKNNKYNVDLIIHIGKQKELGSLLKVTPGVRPEWAAAGDQKRIMTPAEAIKAGATALVIGPPDHEATSGNRHTSRRSEEDRGRNRFGSVRSKHGTKGLAAPVKMTKPLFSFPKRICRQSSKFFKLIFLEKYTVMSYD